MCQAFTVTVGPDALTPDLVDRFTRWGRPSSPVTLSGPAQEFLKAKVGMASAASNLPLPEICVPDSRLPVPALEALGAAVGAPQVLIDPHYPAPAQPRNVVYRHACASSR